MQRLETEIAGVTLKNPIMNANGSRVWSVPGGENGFKRIGGLSD